MDIDKIIREFYEIDFVKGVKGLTITSFNRDELLGFSNKLKNRTYRGYSIECSVDEEIPTSCQDSPFKIIYKLNIGFDKL